MTPTIPLASAYLCVNCSTVSDGATRCAACGSHALISLARVLGSIGVMSQPVTFAKSDLRPWDMRVIDTEKK